MKIIIGIVLVLIVVFAIIKRRNVEKTNVYTWKTDVQKFQGDFINILSKNPNLEYLIVEFDSYYIQYKGFENSKEFYSEVVSNEYLIDGKKYSGGQIDKILRFEFLEPKINDADGNVSPNYSKWYSAKSKSEIENIFNELVDIIETVYELKNGTEIRVRF